MVYRDKHAVIELILAECKIASEAELARLCGLKSQATLYNWWKRDKGWPRSALEILPAVTGISADYLLGKKDATPFPDGPKVVAVDDPKVVGLAGDVFVLRTFLSAHFQWLAENRRDEALAVAAGYRARTTDEDEVWQKHEFAAHALRILDGAGSKAENAGQLSAPRAGGAKSKHQPRSRKHS